MREIIEPMDPSTNPYSPPAQPSEEKHQNNSRPSTVSLFAIVSWPFVYGLNLIVPMGFGWSMTNGPGRAGMFAAVAMFLLGGWAICICQPYYARRLLLGSLLFSLTQVFPILQIIAGAIAMGIVSSLGIVKDDAFILNATGGFIVTCLVGIFCIFLAFMIGLVIGVFIPKLNHVDKETRDNGY